MTPGQARGTLLCFAFLLAGVTVNAIYLQENAAVGGIPRPARTPPPARTAPPRAASEQAAPALRIARFAAEPQPEGGGVPVGVSHETVRAIQLELAAQGFGPLPSDGSVGLATRAAIIAYEHDRGLALTATPSEQLLKRLLLGGGDAGPAHPAAEVASSEAKQVIAEVQRALADLGYLPGVADGRLTAETERAIREFELDKGLIPKGRISAELVRQLNGTASKPAPR
jgi:peptidoglycan hydrolase-like protein with peptidoglycan-binding domain